MTPLLVNEIFATIQGEGTFTGTPAMFVRLQGCDVGCPWCDTKHTWNKLSEYRVTVEDMMRKEKDDPTHAVMDARMIRAVIRARFAGRHIVITGGEPCAQDIFGLTEELIGDEFQVQIETSGTYDVNVYGETWVTVSPKVGMPGLLPVRDQPLQRADEIKMPIGSVRDIANLEAILARMKDTRKDFDDVVVWLQPLSQSAKATELCVRAATDNGWRVSLQAHKFAGLR